jgi:hypothetical protein
MKVYALLRKILLVRFIPGSHEEEAEVSAGPPPTDRQTLSLGHIGPGFSPFSTVNSLEAPARGAEKSSQTSQRKQQ